MLVRSSRRNEHPLTRRLFRTAIGLATVLTIAILLGTSDTAHVHADEPPQMSVNYDHDWVGVEAGTDLDVAIDVKGKATISGSTGESGRFGSHEWTWMPEQPDIRIGDTVTGTVDGMLMVVDPVGKISGKADYEADTVSGNVEAPWLGPQTVTVRCEVWVEDGPSGIEVENIDPDGGSYTCDFNDESWDLQRDDLLAVMYIQPNNHRVINNVEPPRIQVNYGHDWVQVQSDPMAPISVTLASGESVTGMTGEDGWFRSYEWAWSPERPALVPGDVATVSVAGEIAGVVTVGEISSSLDFEADTVSGTIDAPWLAPDFVQVRCEIWEQNGPEGISVADVDPDGGTYSCDFTTRGWDLKPDQTVAVQYTQADGNQVMNNPEAPWVRVNYEHDWVGANHEIGRSFRITVTSASGTVKGIAEVDSVGGGGWGGDGFQTEGEDWLSDHPNIQPNDRVRISADDGFDRQLRVGLIEGSVNVDTDSIMGPIYADWIQETLDVECHAWGSPQHVDDRHASAEADGSAPFHCAWDGVWDVQPGQQIAVFYKLPGSRDLIGSVFHGNGTRYVAKTGSDDNDNQCLTSTAPCQTIGHVLNRTSSGDEIWVAEGTYRENIEEHDLEFVLRGGYTISNSQWMTATGETIIDGDDDGRVLRLENGSITIENLSITGGRTDGDGAGLEAIDGAAVTLNNVRIYDNTSLDDTGGGIAVRDDDSVVTLVDSKVYANQALRGEGGGISVMRGEIRLIRSVVVANATYDNEGGGIAVDEGALYMENSIVAGNQSATSGGGLWTHSDETIRVVNSTIVGNEADDEGAAIAAKDATTIVMTNTLIISNTGRTGIADRDGNNSTFVLNYCDTYGNSPDGTDGVTIQRNNCINSDPRMAGGSLPEAGHDAAADWLVYDFSLNSGSPAIDAGTNTSAPDADIAGKPRPVDGDLDGTPITDMGAYEYSPDRQFLPYMVGD